MQRTKIAEGIYYTYLSGDFKKDRISVHLLSPLNENTLTTTALVPYLLDRGTTDCPDVTLLRRRLNMLYGANLSTSTSSVDFARVGTLSIDGVESSLLPEEGDIFEQRARLLFDVLRNPVVEDDAFKQDWVDIEREKLRERILSEINEKRSYCLKLANEEFFDDERALPNNGFADRLDSIGAAQLYADYRAQLASSQIEIIHVGRGGGRLELVSDLIAALPRDIKRIKPAAPVEKLEQPRRRVVALDVEQDKLALVLTAGRLLTDREKSVFRVANSILGASPTSRLFLNVREKQSLCYYCASRPALMCGGLTIDSGIETGNDERLQQAVLAELADLQKGNITDLELEQSKLHLNNALMSVDNLPDSLAGWYFSSLLLNGGELRSPQAEIDSIASVTKQEVAALLGEFSLKASCLLTAEQEG